jgi:hypothetical protein
MDWGLDRYRVDLDYFRVDIVDTDSSAPDLGAPIPYRPSIPDPAAFTSHLPVAQDAMVDQHYPGMQFASWGSRDAGEDAAVLSVGPTQVVILRWDLTAFVGKKAVGSGLLELTTYALERAADSPQDFGMVRVTEILGGDPAWDRRTVTCNSLCQGKDLIGGVLNSQMIIDVDVAGQRGASNLITISNPVLQRMIDGRTLGLAIRPLGAVHASFYATESRKGRPGAKLHCTVR